MLHDGVKVKSPAIPRVRSWSQSRKPARSRRRHQPHDGGVEDSRSSVLDDSPYAQELRRKESLKPFAPAVEAEFQLVHLRRVRLRVRAWFTVSLLQIVPMTLLDVNARGFANVDSIVKLFVCLPCALLMAWLAWSHHYERHFTRVAPFAVSLQFLAVGYFAAQTMALQGQTQDLALLTFLMTGVMFLSGLSARVAIFSCVLMFCGFVTGALRFGVPTDTLMASVTLLVMSFFVSALVARDMERSQRRGFLESAVIGELVDRDALTGLRNRRAFDERLRQLWQQAQRDRRPIGLLMIDVDYFKQYNDAHGHPAGDVLLRAVASLIHEAARRPLDVAVRYGGDEFAVILYDLGPEDMQGLAEQIRVGVEGLPTREPAVKAYPRVSVSIGAASLRPTRLGSPEAGLRVADSALYNAKRAGRNCVASEGGNDASGIHRLVG
jgi:diguanylate cyclase (GGDEF)-like protein